MEKLLQSLTYKQLLGWIQYANTDGPFWNRQDIHHARLLSALFTIHDAENRSYPPDQFMLKFDEDKPLNVEQQKAYARMIHETVSE